MCLFQHIMGNRRNVLLRMSIVINIAVILYAAMQLSISRDGSPEEWSSPQVIEESERTWVRDPAASASASAPASLSAGGPLEETTSLKAQVSTLSSSNKTTSSTMSSLVAEVDGHKSSQTEPVTDMELDQVEQDALSERTLARLRALLACHERDFSSRTLQRGEYWVLQNFVRADHGPVQCHETITYTTHAGYEFLNNIQPLVERWMAPISLSVFAPGTDLAPAVDSIRYLRDCSSDQLITQFVSFHLFFSHKHVPKSIPDPEKFLAHPYNCSLIPAFENVNSTFMKSHNLLYPVNVARNIARDAALTHFILPSDIELYPSPNMVPRFLNMIARNKAPLNKTNPRIFPISIFEVDANSSAPVSKTELKAMLSRSTAIPFHKYVCPQCHNIPQGQQWMDAEETNQMDVFHVGKRRGKFLHWEPIFIGTHQDPYYDERLSWDGKKDKMTQGYILCVKDYDFMILNNAFLCHRPGIKRFAKNKKRDSVVYRQNIYINSIILPELKKLYGTRSGCAV